MPWYKIYASHGAGHQGYDEEYEYSKERLDKPEKELLWNAFVQKGGWFNCSGDVKYVRKLPEEIRLKKIKQYKDEISGCKRMLLVLRKGDI